MGSKQALSRDSEEEAILQALRAAAASAGASAWLVGGYVRDRLLGRPHREIDVVVADGRGAEVADAFAALTGSGHPVHFPRYGTAQVMWRERPVEFVSARIESYSPASRKPEVQPASLDDDLRRRDFTVNTLVMDLEGRVEDRLGQGLADLRAGLLRTPLDPERTFDDDPLRMLRAIRFAAQLGFELDPAILPAIRRLRSRARPPVLSVERATDELKKMLLSDRPEVALDLLHRSGLMEILLPEVSACEGVEQGGYHDDDVLGHTIRAVAAAPAELTVRLAALLHDIGKPVTATADGRFLGHETVGAEMAAEALRRLRVSNAILERVDLLVRLHLRPVFYDSGWTDGAVRRLAAAAGEAIWDLVALARADVAASAYPEPQKLDELEGRLRSILAEQPSRLRLPVDGNDIMRELHLEPGPAVKAAKARLEEMLIDGALEPTREDVLEYLRSHPRLADPPG